MMCVEQLETGKAEVENQYTRAVRRGGNVQAIEMIRKVFRVIPRKWRGVGEIPQSGLGLAPDYQEFDAEPRFGIGLISVEEPAQCISGEVLRGIKKPTDCPEFGASCTPEHPLGATMVSSEGACSAYYRYRNVSLNEQDHG